MSSKPSDPENLQPPKIECSHVTVSFSDHQTVLRDLNFVVEPGRIVSLLGPSGCGKSTLLRSLAGLQPVTAGGILIGGQSPAIARSKMSYVFQDAGLLPWRNIWDNVGLPLELEKKPPSIRKERITKALESVGLAPEHFRKLPSQLSGGMKMRASIARALVRDPALILMDEPFAALDDMLRSRLNDLLLRLHRQRTRTIIFVTHNIAEAVFLSHHVAMLMNGRIVKQVDIPFAQPRMPELRSDPPFVQLCSEIARYFVELVDTSKQLEAGQ